MGCSSPVSHVRRVGQGAGAALLAQAVGVGLGYVVHVLLARWLGTAMYGVYTYVLAWAMLLVLPASAGIPSGVVRFLPAYRAQGRWGAVRGLLRWSLVRVTGIGLVVGAALVVGALMWAAPPFQEALIVGGGLVVLQALFNLLSGLLRAVHRIGRAHLLPALRHAVLLGGAALVVVGAGQLSSAQAVGLTAGATVLAGAVMLPSLREVLPPAQRQAAPVYEARAWWHVSWPLLLVAGFVLLLNQTDLLMVGTFLGAREAGLYGAASRTAMLVSLVPAAVGAAADPMIAELYAAGRHAALQRLASAGVRWALFGAAGVALALAGLGRWVLGLFGGDFVQAWPLLLLLAGGHVAHASIGVAGGLLNLTGHHRTSLLVFGACAVLNVALNALGIWLGGMTGAALATLASLVMLSTLLWWAARRTVHVDASIVYALWRGRTPAEETAPPEGPDD